MSNNISEAHLLARLDAVEKIAASMYRIAEFNLSIRPGDDMGISLKQHAEDLRAAISGYGGGKSVTVRIAHADGTEPFAYIDPRDER